MEMQKETQEEYAETLEYYKSQHTTLDARSPHDRRSDDCAVGADAFDQPQACRQSLGWGWACSSSVTMFF